MGKNRCFFPLYPAGERTLSLRLVRQMLYHYPMHQSILLCVPKDTQALHIHTNPEHTHEHASFQQLSLLNKLMYRTHKLMYILHMHFSDVGAKTQLSPHRDNIVYPGITLSDYGSAHSKFHVPMLYQFDEVLQSYIKDSHK